VVVLAQVDDLAHDLDMGGPRAHQRPLGAVTQPLDAIGLVAAIPDVVSLAADAVVAAVSTTLPVTSSAWRMIARRHRTSRGSGGWLIRSPRWLETRSVNHLRQFQIYLRRHGEEVGGGVGTGTEAKSSHGRGHRFETCQAHQGVTAAQGTYSEAS
jgi:hypothetical protein